ncbi:hypothetical protein P7C73_g4505, partial [Tremellales sp. Uapishka_1]
MGRSKTGPVTKKSSPPIGSGFQLDPLRRRNAMGRSPLPQFESIFPKHSPSSGKPENWLNSIKSAHFALAPISTLRGYSSLQSLSSKTVSSAHPTSRRTQSDSRFSSSISLDQRPSPTAAMAPSSTSTGPLPSFDSSATLAESYNTETPNSGLSTQVASPRGEKPGLNDAQRAPVLATSEIHQLSRKLAEAMTEEVERGPDVGEKVAGSHVPYGEIEVERTKLEYYYDEPEQLPSYSSIASEEAEAFTFPRPAKSCAHLKPYQRPKPGGMGIIAFGFRDALRRCPIPPPPSTAADTTDGQ